MRAMLVGACGLERRDQFPIAAPSTHTAREVLYDTATGALLAAMHPDGAHALHLSSPPGSRS
jgi:hypothetical protein